MNWLKREFTHNLVLIPVPQYMRVHSCKHTHDSELISGALHWLQRSNLGKLSAACWPSSWKLRQHLGKLYNYPRKKNGPTKMIAIPRRKSLRCVMLMLLLCALHGCFFTSPTSFIIAVRDPVSSTPERVYGRLRHPTLLA